MRHARPKCLLNLRADVSQIAVTTAVANFIVDEARNSLNAPVCLTTPIQHLSATSTLGDV